MRGRLLHESNHLPALRRRRWSTSPADIEAGVLTLSQKRTRCPYKGDASYWNVRGIEDGAWSHESPLPDAAAVGRHVGFWGDGIELELAEPADRLILGSA